MKLTALRISNFIGARAVDVKLTTPVTLFTGRNGSGKSSLMEAVRMALTGEAVRVDLKKNYAGLVTEGQQAGFVQVDTVAGQYNVVLPSGKWVHAAHAALPFVLDAQRFARMDNKERSAFLFGLMSIKLDGASITKLMLGKGLNAEKVGQIDPYLRTGFDTAHHEAEARARDAKATWKTITGGQTWGKDKAEKWKPNIPEGAENAAALLESAKVKQKEIRAELDKLNQDLGAARNMAALRRGFEQERERLTQQASRHDSLLKKLAHDEAELKQLAATLADARQRASAGRKPGLVHALAVSLSWALSKMIPIGELDGYERERLAEVNTVIESYRAEYGKIQDAPQKPDPEAAARLPEYEKALELMKRSVDNDQRDILAAEHAAARLAEMEKMQAGEAAGVNMDTLENRLVELNRQFSAASIDERQYRAISEAYAGQQSAIQTALRNHRDVLDWLAIAKALAPDGIPGEMLAEALEPINDRLDAASVATEWLQVHIDQDMSVWAAYPGRPPRPYALLSESEKWRADAMIAEAIAHISGIKLLVLDRFDVLDLQGRGDLIDWLDGLATDGQIETALLFGTLKALPSNLPKTVDAVWIENGKA